MLAGTLAGVEMGLGLAGVPYRPGGVMAALGVLAPAKTAAPVASVIVDAEAQLFRPGECVPTSFAAAVEDPIHEDSLDTIAPLPLSSHAKPVDSFAQAADLERELTRTIRGEVRFDRGSRALYATDGSNYRQIPIGVVVPRDADDVVAAVAACRKYDAPVLPRGAGTSLAGQCCNVAVVLDFTKYMNRILEI